MFEGICKHSKPLFPYPTKTTPYHGGGCGEARVYSVTRKKTNPVVDEGRFIYKVRNFFTGKVDGAVGSESDPRAHHIQKSTNQIFKIFTYDELVSATNGFINEVHFPPSYESIYEGWVDERTYAPSEYSVGLAIYVSKMQILPWKILQKDLKLEEFNHPNLSKLLGYCLDKQEILCVYELIHTSLDKYLYGGTNLLSWVARLKIALGAAQGLAFLHQRNKPAYNQFKTSLILVDKDFNARLSDFDFDFNFPIDAYYAAPEWFRYQADSFDSLLPWLPGDGFAVKSEIYAFGVVLLEMLTGG